MSNPTTHTWSTPEYSYEFAPIDAGTIRVQSDNKQAIDDFLSTVELAGSEDGTEIPTTIEQEQSFDWGNEVVYFIEVSRATVSLFLDFDVRYYMGVPTP